MSADMLSRTILIKALIQLASVGRYLPFERDLTTNKLLGSLLRATGILPKSDDSGSTASCNHAAGFSGSFASRGDAGTEALVLADCL